VKGITYLPGSKAVCVLLCNALFFAAVPSTYGQERPSRLNLVIVDGEGAINNVNQRADHDPVVRVEDENGKPIPGAAVVFTLPTDGSSGEFGNGERNLTVTTDAQGRAAAQGLKANNVPGRVLVHVNASYRGLTARINITQFNMAVPGRSTVSKSSSSGHKGHKKLFIILAVVGAGAAGGIVAATSGGGSSTTGSASSAPPIVISPGSGAVGPPR
jgi:hypothetical protein